MSPHDPAMQARKWGAAPVKKMKLSFRAERSE